MSRTYKSWKVNTQNSICTRWFSLLHKIYWILKLKLMQQGYKVSKLMFRNLKIKLIKTIKFYESEVYYYINNLF